MQRWAALTGATGFIGSNVLTHLLSAGWRVRALYRPAEHPPPAASGLEWVPGDLGDPSSLARLVRDTAAVVHCAGAVRGGSLSDFEPANVHGVANLAAAAHRQERRPRLLLLSSLAAREPTLSPYAASKRAGEEALARGPEGLEWVALRPPAVYGPGDREILPLLRWMRRGVAPRVGRADARFSMLFVEDLAAAVHRWLETPAPHRAVCELHDGHRGGYSWAEVARTAGQLRGGPVRLIPVPAALLRVLARVNAAAAYLFRYPPMLTPGKVRELCHRDWVCTNDEWSAATGWVPKVTLEDGLRRTLQWQR